MIDFASSLIIVTALINAFVAAWIFHKNMRNASILWFSAFASTLVIWCVAILITHLSRIPEQAIIWGRLIYGSGLLIATALFIFANVFPHSEYKLSKRLKLVVLGSLILFFPLTTFTDYVIKEAQIPLGGEAMAHYGLLYPFYFVYMIGFLAVALYLLFRTYRRSEGHQRTQALYIFMGVLFTILVGGTTNLILPSFGYFNFWVAMGPASTLFVIFFVIYAILKHHLLGLKVVGIEILALLIVVSVLTEVLLSRSSLELFIRIPIFVSVIVFAYLLIHGTFKQIASSRKIQTQAQELEKVNISLKELLGMKTELLNTISHQLRTPTTIFRSMLSMITEGDVAGQQKEKFIKDSYAAANRLLLIVDSIMEASSFEGKLPDFDFKAVQIDNIINQSMNIFAVIAKAKSIDLEYQKSKEPLPTIMADDTYLKSALNKLIDNAIWYTRDNGKVVISAEFNQEQKTVSIKVKDTGIGLTEEDKKILFQRFSKGRGAKMINVNSSGLGLYIAKKIIQGHRGEITAESEGEDKGSIFTITLPVMQEI